MTRRQLQAFLATAALSVIIALTAQLLRRRSLTRCALDGLPLAQSYAVRLEAADGKSLPFCCVYCAESWIRRSGSPPRRATCTDEVTGKPLDCGVAVFVKSGVITQPTTGNRIHVFARRSEALAHLQQVGGALLQGTERPLQLSSP